MTIDEFLSIPTAEWVDRLKAAGFVSPVEVIQARVRELEEAWADHRGDTGGGGGLMEHPTWMSEVGKAFRERFAHSPDTATFTPLGFFDAGAEWERSRNVERIRELEAGLREISELAGDAPGLSRLNSVGRIARAALAGGDATS